MNAAWRARVTDDCLISVVIPAYNAARFLGEAIESVLAQTHRHVELIVVDDGSTDDTRALLRTYGPSVRVIRQEHDGVSAARNRGIAAARGAFLALLDADDAWLPDKLQAQLEEAQEHPTAGLVTCGTYYVDERGTIVGEVDAPVFTNREQVLRTLLLRNWLVGGPSTVLMPTQVLEAVGLFNPALCGAEDWDLWIRVAQRFELRSVARPLSRYRVHSGNAHKQIERMMQSQRFVLAAHAASLDWADRRKAYSCVYGDAAAEYYGLSQRSLARVNALKAIASYPLRAWPGDDKYAILIKSLLPVRLATNGGE